MGDDTRPRAQAHSSHGGRSSSSSVDVEAVLAGVLALANLFSNCVEAFNLIHPTQRWSHDEQLLLCRLGIQQARLLIWGDVVGISSPPTSVTDRAVPRYPSASYPDTSEPVFFGARDERLDEAGARTAVERALSSIVDRSATSTREEMMARYGLKAPKRTSSDIYQPPLDTNRLESFRERFELLQEVAEAYAHLSTRRNASLVHHSWNIADEARFDAFIALTRDAVDELIALMGVRERVDRALRQDIKAIGWHLTADRTRVGHDGAKLRLLRDACRAEYPEYLDAIEIALANIERDWEESAPTYNPYAAQSESQQQTHKSPRVSVSSMSGEAEAAAVDKPNKPHHGLLGGLFKGFRHQKAGAGKPRSTSIAGQPGAARSLSDSGPTSGSDGLMPTLEPVRSKSVGASVDAGTDGAAASTAAGGGGTPTSAPASGEGSSEADPVVATPIKDASHEALSGPHPPQSPRPVTLQARPLPLRTRSDTLDTVDLPLEGTSPVASMISRHDMYRGLGRQGTKNQ